MKKRWIQKSVCNGYIILVDYADEGLEHLNIEKLFIDMWDAIDFMKK